MSDIENMVAGRDLDYIVAEKVMKITGVNATYDPGPDWDDVPRFSTESAAAWEVIDHLHPRGFGVDFSQPGIVEVTLFLGSNPIKAAAATVELAICHAALKAVE